MNEYNTANNPDNYKKFINAVDKAARKLPKGHKLEFLCPCCGQTAFIAREPDIGDSYAWCECGMKHYKQQSEEEQKRHSRSCDAEL